MSPPTLMARPRPALPFPTLPQTFSVATVDASTGALTLLAAGVSTIVTGTGVRGSFSHDASGLLTITAIDPNAGDFTASLTLA